MHVQSWCFGGGGRRLYLEGLLHGGAYFRNISVCPEIHAMAMMQNCQRVGEFIRDYKRCSSLSGEVDKNGESDEKGESGENYSHGFGFGEYSN